MHNPDANVTMPAPRYATDLHLQNLVNERERHCRIGRVVSKRPVSVPSVFQPSMWPPYTGTPDELLKGTMPKCGCKLGSVCMNAACPHAARVICSTADILGDQRQRVTVGSLDWFEQVRV